jgi:hypothetical protein
MHLKKMLATICCIAVMAGCETPFKYKKQVMEAGPLIIYGIAAQQTAAEQRKDSVQYRNGFEVLHTYQLSAAQSEELKEQLINGKNYSEADSKRCVFMPAYLIEKDTAFKILISTAPCSKVSFTEGGKESIIDLVNDNGIEKFIASLKNQ